MWPIKFFWIALDWNSKKLIQPNSLQLSRQCFFFSLIFAKEIGIKQQGSNECLKFVETNINAQGWIKCAESLLIFQQYSASFRDS